MSKIVYTKDDRVKSRTGEFFEISSCYTTPRSVSENFGDLFGDVDELQNKPRRFFDHILSNLELQRELDPNRKVRKEYWDYMIAGAEMWLSAVEDGLYGQVINMSRPVKSNKEAIKRQKEWRRQERELDSL